MSSTHCSTLPSRPRRLRSSSSNFLSSASMSSDCPASGSFVFAARGDGARLVAHRVLASLPSLSGVRRVVCSIAGGNDFPSSVFLPSFTIALLRPRAARAPGVGHVGLELRAELLDLGDRARRPARGARPSARLAARGARGACCRSRARSSRRTLARVLEALLVELERVGVRLDADLDRACRLVRVDVVERRVRRLALLDDRVDQAVGRRVVAALERREVEHDDVRVVRREDGAPRPSARC